MTTDTTAGKVHIVAAQAVATARKAYDEAVAVILAGLTGLNPADFAHACPNPEYEPVTLDTMSRHLRQSLSDLGDDYGPRGVVEACYLIWPSLAPAPIPNAEVVQYLPAAAMARNARRVTGHFAATYDPVED